MLAKRLYYGKKIEEAKSNIKSTWRILNEVLNNKSKKQNLPSLFRSGNEELSDPVKIAEQFCKYFTNIGPSLASNIPASEKLYRSYLYGNFVNSLFFEKVTEQEINEICSSLRVGTAMGFDNVPMSIIKESICSISDPLTHIVNLSITSGIVPTELKTARVIPLFKTDDKSLISKIQTNLSFALFFKIFRKSHL